MYIAFYSCNIDFKCVQNKTNITIIIIINNNKKICKFCSCGSWHFVRPILLRLITLLTNWTRPTSPEVLHEKCQVLLKYSSVWLVKWVRLNLIFKVAAFFDTFLNSQTFIDWIQKKKKVECWPMLQTRLFNLNKITCDNQCFLTSKIIFYLEKKNSVEICITFFKSAPRFCDDKVDIVLINLSDVCTG